MKKFLKIVKIILLTLIGLLLVSIIAGIILYQTTFKEPVHEIMSSIDHMIESSELIVPESAEADLSLTDEQNSDEPAEDQGVENPSPSDPETNTPKKPVEEYKSTYDYVKDNVAPSDFAKGSSLASRVDIGYILGLLSGGLTKEEKKELLQYLSERFTEAEINEGVALYKKYSYLLREASKK